MTADARPSPATRRRVHRRRSCAGSNAAPRCSPTLQCGVGRSRRRGRRRRAACLHRIAPDAPMATWPVRFWSLLLAAPDMRRTADDAAWPATWASLGAAGQRAARRLAAAIGGGAGDGRSGRRARRAGARRIATRCSARFRIATTARPIARRGRRGSPMCAHRPKACRPIASRGCMRRHRRPARCPRRRPHHWHPNARLRGAGSAYRHRRRRRARRGPRRSRIVPSRNGSTRCPSAENSSAAPSLPPADEPVARYDADLAAWTHRDFLAIADPDGVRRADQFPFFAWYAATLAVQPAADASAPATPAKAVVPAAVARRTGTDVRRRRRARRRCRSPAASRCRRRRHR